MARATRATANGSAEKNTDVENEAPPENPSLTSKAAKAALNKKRKRMSEIEAADVPSPKQSRSDEGEVTPTPDDAAVVADAQDSRFPPLAGDLSLVDDDAQKILDILDVADEQGLLDRVFPLDDVLGVESSSLPSSSKSPSDSYSLRMLLKESSQRPLRVLKSAVKQLYPLSSQPRSRASPPAQQQRRFCELALSLIDQASNHTLDGLALDPELVLPDSSMNVDEDGGNEASIGRRKYALVQRLPKGEYWTSLNSDNIGSDSKPLVDSDTGYAELVAIMPLASSSKPPPTLGDLHADRVLTTRLKPLTSLPVTCGSFLSYGPYSSFAPSFDSDCGDMGFNAVSSVLWRRREKGKAREKARILGDRMRHRLAQQAQESMDVDGMEVEDAGDARDQLAEERRTLVKKVFDDEEEASAALAVLDALEREDNVDELVRQNGEALYRLSLLQEERFRNAKAKGKISSVEQDLAQKIMDSLTLLASLRPRINAESGSVIVPPMSALRKLQKQLPLQSSSGWYGTLADDRAVALCDDTTVNVQNVPAAPPTPAPIVPPATPTFTSNPYADFAQNYRTSYSGQPNMPVSQASATPIAQRTQNQYQQAQANAYAQWFAQHQQQQVRTGFQPPTPARLNIPQQGAPQTPQQMPLGTAFFPYGAHAHTPMPANNVNSTPTRAVSNTLVGKLQAAVGISSPSPGAGAVNNGLALPAHMRQQAATGSPLAYANFP